MTCMNYSELEACDDVSLVGAAASRGVIWDETIPCPYCQVALLDENEKAPRSPLRLPREHIESLTGLNCRMIDLLSGTDEANVENLFWTSETVGYKTHYHLRTGTEFCALFLGGHWRAIPEFRNQVLVDNYSKWFSAFDPAVCNERDLKCGSDIFESYFDHLITAKCLIPKYFNDAHEHLKLGCNHYDVGCARDQLIHSEDRLVSMLRLWRDYAKWNVVSSVAEHPRRICRAAGMCHSNRE